MSCNVKNCCKKNSLSLATLVGVALGVALGLALKSQATEEQPWTERQIMYISFPAKLFLQMLKCTIVPLIGSSLICSIGSLELNLSRRVGTMALIYYMTTTVSAVLLGLLLVTTIQPGVGSNSKQNLGQSVTDRNMTTADTLMDLVRNCFPSNIIQATMQTYRTEVVNEDGEFVIKGKWVGNTNVLGLVTVSVATGIAIAAAGEGGKVMLAVCVSLTNVVRKITGWIINLAPIGICFLITGQILVVEDFGEAFQQLGWYFTTVMLGLGLHGGIVLPLLYSLITRSWPFVFIANVTNALSTAFATGSSSATLPVTFDCLESLNKVDKKISRFILPIGATINMDGTALYEAIAVIFIAQVRGLALSMGTVVSISIMATAASIGAATIPQSGLVTMVMVLDSAGLSAEDIGLILSVDWLLDRFRTSVNVLGDCIGSGIVNHLTKSDLADMKPVELEDALLPSERETES